MDGGLRDFAEIARRPEPEMDLGLGALEVARIEYPDLDPAVHLRRLDELAERSAVRAEGDPVRALHRLREFLFEEEGFRGNTDDYYDPRNSCLNDVLERKVGIPITLALVTMEVGRRLGLAVEGIGLPGHFVVSVAVGEGPVLLDPFDGGTVITRERAGQLVARALGRRVRLNDAHFAPVTRRHILGRMLSNLEAIYVRAEAWDRALATVERFILLDEDSSVHLRDRGLVLVKLGRLHAGAADLERYLTRRPAAADAEGVRKELQRVRRHLGALN